jgi:hypothetical protein
VRELEAVLEQAVVFRAGEWITPADLDLPLRGGRVAESGAVEREGASAPNVALSWLQQEVLGIASAHREVRRRDVIARCRISRELARCALVGLVRLGLLRRIGLGRGARYVPLSWWFTLMNEMAEWALALV